jgi:pseudaminic acid synthase
MEGMMSDELTISGRKIGPENPPFVIAELSGNHNQSLERALELITVAAQSGVHAVKFQTYTPETMTLDLDYGDFFISDTESLWEGRSLYDLYAEAHTPWDWHEEMFSHARSLGLIPFSSPFDQSAVDFLEELDTPCYKIASFESTDLPLVRYVASKGRPMIISTGMSTAAEIDETVRAVRDEGCEEFVLLKCTSSYPSTPEDTNILTIPHMREMFDCQVGLSDHTRGVGVSVASVALGATVLEKHFTLNRSDGGVDSSFSMEPEELKQLVAETERAWLGLGRIFYGATSSEAKSLQFRRSIYVCQDIKVGDVFSSHNMRIIRPGFGLEPKYFDKVMGKKATTDIARGTALTWDLL